MKTSYIRAFFANRLDVVTFSSKKLMKFLSASPVTGKITRYLLPLTRVQRRWGKDNRIFLKIVWRKQGGCQSPLSSASQEGGTEAWQGSATPHHHSAESQGTWAPSSPRLPPHPALHRDSYMQEGPHQEPATASPSLQAQPCLEVLTAKTECFTEGLRTGNTAKLWECSIAGLWQSHWWLSGQGNSGWSLGPNGWGWSSPQWRGWTGST